LKKTKKRKKTTPKKKLIKQLEDVIRIYIRKRDNNLCQKCSKQVFGSNSHVSHVIPKSRGNFLRFNEQNLKLLCSGCHLQYWHLNPLEAGEWFANKFPKRYKYLQESKSYTMEFTETDYKNMIKEYKSKCST